MHLDFYNKNMNIKIFAKIISFTLFVIPFFVLSDGLTNPLQDASIEAFIARILGYVTRIGSVVATFSFVFVGYLFASAGGNSGKIEKAKNAFITTMIAVAIMLGAQLIGQMLVNTVGSIK